MINAADLLQQVQGLNATNLFTEEVGHGTSHCHTEWKEQSTFHCVDIEAQLLDDGKGASNFLLQQYCHTNCFVSLSMTLALNGTFNS